MWYALVMDGNREKFNEPETRARVSAIAEKYHLSLALLFGSQATGKTHIQSDVDIAISASHALRPRELAELAYDLSQALQAKEVDIVDLHGAPPLLLAQIARFGQLLYERESSMYARFRIYAIKRFMEAKPLFNMRDAFIAAKLKHV